MNSKINTLEDLEYEFMCSHFYIRLAKSTKYSYLFALAKLCDLYGLKECVNHIDRSRAYNYFSRVSKDSGHSTAIHYTSALRRIFGIAMREWEWIDKNPFEKLDIKALPPRDVVWTKDEIKDFVAASIRFGYPSVGLIALLCFETMQRPGDIIKLTWADYDYPTKSLIIKQSKTGQTVIVPVSGEVQYLILEVETKTKTKIGVYICGRETDNHKWDHSNLNKIVRKIKAEAGIRQEVQLRDLRRTAATEAVNAGVTEDELRAVGGWKSRQVISVYAQAGLQAAQNAQNKRWAKRLEEVNG